jgi:hypothetical protein
MTAKELPAPSLSQPLVNLCYRTGFFYNRRVAFQEAPIPLRGSLAGSVSLSAPLVSLLLSTRGLESASKLPAVLSVMVG